MSLPASFLLAPLAAPRLAGPGGWGIALAVLLGLLAWALYRRQLSAAPRWQRHTLPTLRGLAVAAVALMLAQPSFFHRETRLERGQITLLADASASMSVADSQADPGRKLLIARSLDLAPLDDVDFHLADLAEAVQHLQREAQSGDVDALPDLAEKLTAIAETLSELDASLFRQIDARGSALVETWSGTPGHLLSEFQRQDFLSRPPESVDSITQLQLPRDADDDYARRIRGLLHPAETGAYRFHLAADATAELFLGTTADVETLQSVVAVRQKTVPDDFSVALSDTVRLEGGQAYAFELRHKEGEGDDHLSLAWSRDGQPPVIVQGESLSPPPATLTAQQVKEQLLREFEAEMVEPARTMAQALGGDDVPPDDEAVQGLAETLGDWEERFRDLFSAWVADRLATGDESVSAAVQAFDAMTRTQRLARRMQGTAGMAGAPGLVATLDNAGDVEVQQIGTENASNLTAPLAGIEPQGDRPQAVILLSDGRHNGGDSPVEAATALGRRGVAVYPVSIGSPRPPRDLSVLEVVGPDAVHREDRIAGRIVLLDTMPPGEAFDVRILSGEELLWQERSVTTGAGRREIEFSLPAATALAAAALGEQAASAESSLNELLLAMRVEVEPVTGETQQGNNIGDLPVRVTLGNGRLLIVDGRPRWETRYIDTLLGRDQRWEVTSVLGPDESGGTLPRGPEGFPGTREALFEYDVVVLGEVPEQWWRDEELQWLREFVDERGGGLVLIDGVRGALTDYSATPLAPLLPVERLDAPPLQAVRLRLTPAGEQSDALRLEPEQLRNTQLWPALPPPRWVVPAQPLTGATQVLAEAETDDGSRWPVIVTARVGRGRVWYQAFDETWRWRRQAESRWQSRYWSGVANRIMEPPFAAEDRYVSIGAEEAAVEPGEELAVRARLRDDQGRSLTGEAARQISARAVVWRDGIEVSSAPLEPDASGGGLFRAAISAPAEPGYYEIGASADRFSDSETTARAGLLVRRPAASGELARLDADESLLRQLATASGGQFLREEEAGRLPQLLSDLSRQQTVTSEYHLWTSWPLFTGIITLLGAEWLIRRKTGMM